MSGVLESGLASTWKKQFEPAKHAKPRYNGAEFKSNPGFTLRVKDRSGHRLVPVRVV